MSIANANLPEDAKIVTGLTPVVPSTSSPAYVSMSKYNRMTVIITGINTTGVTGSAITLLQASAIAGTGEKALAFSQYWANLNTAATDTLVLTNATSNTFTTLTTSSVGFMYVLEVQGSALDVTNSFDCVRLGTANAVNATINVTYIMRDPRFAAATPPSAILD